MELFEIVWVAQGVGAEAVPEVVIDREDDEEVACQRVWQLLRDVRGVRGAPDYYVRPVTVA